MSAAEEFDLEQTRKLAVQLGHEIMDEDSARDLTTRIKEAGEQTWDLLTEANDRRAYLAIGYSTFEAYCSEEFGMSRSYAYRLIAHGTFMRELSAATDGVSPMGDIPERAARDLHPGDVPAVADRIANGASPQEAVQAEVARKRSASKPAKAAVTEGPSVLKTLLNIEKKLTGISPSFVSDLAPVQRREALEFVRETRSWLNQLERQLKAPV